MLVEGQIETGKAYLNKGTTAFKALVPMNIRHLKTKVPFQLYFPVHRPAIHNYSTKPELNVYGVSMVSGNAYRNLSGFYDHVGGRRNPHNSYHCSTENFDFQYPSTSNFSAPEWYDHTVKHCISSGISFKTIPSSLSTNSSPQLPHFKRLDVAD